MLKVKILNKGKTVLEKDLSKKDFKGFNKEYSYIHGFGFVIALFKFFYKIDISEYKMSDVMVDDGLITLNIKAKDLSKIRELKLNKLIGE